MRGHRISVGSILPQPVLIPENPQTSAVISMSTGIASGWMRALSYNKSYDDGWDGLIKITDATTTNGYLNGWAWGGLVVGWLNFQNVSVSALFRRLLRLRFLLPSPFLRLRSRLRSEARRHSSLSATIRTAMLRRRLRRGVRAVQRSPLSMRRVSHGEFPPEQ